MHPQVTASEPATCPLCGMKLVPAEASAISVPGGPSGHDHGDGKGGQGEGSGSAG